MGPLRALAGADESLIDLDHATVAAHRRKVARAHCFANTVRQKPRGFDGQAKGAGELVRANALLATGNKEDCL